MESPIDAAEQAAEKSARWDFLQFLQRFCRLCAAVGRRSAAAGAALWRLVRSGIKKLCRGLKPSKKEASACLSLLQRVYRLCAAIGLKSAAAGAALWRLMCGGLEKISQAFRPSKVGKKGMVLSILNYGGPVVAAAALVLTVVFWAGRSFGIEVRYEGESLGYISSEEVFDGAVERINDQLALRTGQDILSEPTFSFAMLSGRQVMDEAQLADALITHSDDITQAYGLFLDDKLLTTAGDPDVLRTALDAYLESYRAGMGNEGEQTGLRAAFMGELSIEEGVYPASAVNSDAQAKADIAAGGTDEAKLEVKVIMEEIYEEEIPFATVEVPDGTRLEDYRKTKTEGKNGVASVTAQVTYIDGQEIDRQVLSSEVVTEPTDQQVVVGTMTMSQYEEQKAMSSAKTAESKNSSFVWPVGASNYVSAYYGDGRGHKGYDIASSAGAPILAADSGKVVSVNATGSAYGLHFVVDHGNGVQTLYAHCSSMNVSVGQKVSRGEVIARVGRTGRATGNHLHFEVWENGSRVNPSRYLK
ncbi:MAG: peptidoglycan DD-metalloendopeptidase family protein [Clostridiales bacterium]|nr:peptidoglycan DD-metalloendopeptidase family protein [Clostridiales bacterium]